MSSGIRALARLALCVALSVLPGVSRAVAQDCRSNFGGAYTAPHEGFKPNSNFFSTVAFFNFNPNGTFTVSAVIDEQNFGTFRATASSAWWWVGPCDIAIDRAAFIGVVSSNGRFIDLATFDTEQLAGQGVRDATPAEAANLQPPGGNPLGPQNVFSQTMFGQLFAGVLADQFAERAAALRSATTGFSAAATAAFDLGPGGLRSLFQTAQATQLAATDGGIASVPWDSSLGGFISGQGAFGNRTLTPRETGRPFITGGATFGLDYRLDPLLAVGIAASYFAGNLNASGGSTDAQGAAASLYGTTLSGPAYFDGFVSGGFTGFDATRSVSLGGFLPMESGAPSGHFIAFGGNTGYRFEQRPVSSLLSWGPVGELRFNNVGVGSYMEAGNPSLSSQIRGRDVTSVQSGLGAEAWLKIPTPLGVLMPHLRATWRHEFADTIETASFNFVVAPDLPFVLTSSSLGRDFARIGAGVSGRLGAGVTLSADYIGEVGRRNETVHQAALMVRIAF